MNKSAHILIVNDEPDTVEILSRQLNMENYNILKAYNGKEGLKLLEQHKPDLVLMDIKMPEMDGFETIRSIRGTVKDFIPIIIITASKDDTESIARGFAVGANDYIVNPCNKEELLSRIKAMLKIKELHDALGEKNRELTEANDKILKLNESLEQRVTERTAELEAFAYSISHDLRAPLRAIDSFARIISESHGAHVGREDQHCLHVIQDNCRQMERLIQGLLTFSRLSRQPLNKQKVDIHDLVNSVLKEFQAERRGRCIKIILGDLPACEADPLLLHQAWFNLISNALKFTRQNKEARIEIGSQQKENQCVYFVKDNGVGFDMQYVHKLFNVFARLHRAEDYEGTGVGLAIVQRIILRHGGRVWIESEVNRGTTVYFTLA